MYCTICGKELPDDATVCSGCGAKFQNGSPSASAEESSGDRIPEDKADDSAAPPHRPYMDYRPFSGDSGQNPGEGSSGEESSYASNPYGKSLYGTSGQNPYGGSREQPAGPTGLAIASLVLGILAICSCCLPFFTIPLGILGLIFAAYGMRSIYRGIAIAGLVLNIIALVFGSMMLLLLLMNESSYFSHLWRFLD